MFGSRFTFDICEMGKESNTSRENCDFNSDKIVGNGKREITIFKIQNFSGNVIWEVGFVKRNLRKMRPSMKVKRLDNFHDKSGLV